MRASRPSRWPPGATPTSCWSAWTSLTRSSALAPPRRPGCTWSAWRPTTASSGPRSSSGAASVIDLPAGAGWLVDALADVGERVSPGRVVGVVGGAGGAGASTLACALAQWHAARAPTLLVDTDPLGPGLDRLLGLEEVPGVRWDGLADDRRPTRCAGAARERAATRRPRRADLVAGCGGGSTCRPRDGSCRRRCGGTTWSCSTSPGTAASVLAELVDRCDDLLVVTPATVPGLAATARLVADLGRPRRAGLVVRPGGARATPTPNGSPACRSSRQSADQRGLAASVDRGLGPLAGRGPLARPCADLLAEVA